MGRFLVAMILISLTTAARADDSRSIPARMDCKPFRGDTSAPGFTDKISFIYSKGVLTASRGGRDTFTGTIDPLGRIDLDGKWKFENDSSDWEYHFSGQLVREGVTVLSGGLKVSGGAAGERRCTILFQLPAADLLKRFAPQAN